MVIGDDGLALTWEVLSFQHSTVKLYLIFFCAGIWQNQTPISAPNRNVGPPLRHPLDPRHKYVAEEQEMLDAATAVGEKEEGQPQANVAHPASYDWKPDALRLAAEQKAEYGEK